MKCLKCDGELHPVIKDGRSYAQCDKCGALFTRHDLKNHAPQPPAQPQSHHSAQPPSEPNEDERRGMGRVAAVIGWTLCVLFLIFGLATGGASLIIFLIAALLINPIFRNHVYISGKIWIPLVIVLFIAGIATSPTTDIEPKKVAEKQEAPAASVKKQTKASSEKQTKKFLEEKEAAKEKAKKEEQERAAQEQAKREEQERIAQEQAAAQAEQERIAQEQAAAKAEQERIAQEEAAAKAEQERIAQEQAAKQAEQERIAREQAEQQRIAQEQAEQQRIAQEQANTQNNFNTHNNPEQQQSVSSYVLNTNTNVFHYPNCRDVSKISAENYATSDGTRDDIISQGYRSCGHCNP